MSPSPIDPPASARTVVITGASSGIGAALARAFADRGDRVTIDVLRGGERIRLYGVRGPMGIKLRPARRLPESGW